MSTCLGDQTESRASAIFFKAEFLFSFSILVSSSCFYPQNWQQSMLVFYSLLWRRVSLHVAATICAQRPKGSNLALLRVNWSSIELSANHHQGSAKALKSLPNEGAGDDLRLSLTNTDIMKTINERRTNYNELRNERRTN